MICGHGWSIGPCKGIKIGCKEYGLLIYFILKCAVEEMWH